MNAPSTSSVRFLAAALLLTALLAACRDGGGPAPPGGSPDAPAPPPPAKETLAKLAERLGSLQALDLEVTFERVKQMDEIDERTTGAILLAFNRPNQYFYEVNVPGFGEWPLIAREVSDGKQLASYDSFNEEYFFDTAPSRFGELNLSLLAYYDFGDYYFVPASMLAAAEPLRYLMAEVVALKALEPDPAAKRPEDRLLLEQTTADILLVIDRESKLPARIVVDFLKKNSGPEWSLRLIKQKPCNYIAFDYQVRSVDVTIPDKRLAFEKPKSAVEILNPRGEAGATTKPLVLAAEELDRIGEVAYPFTLPDAAGADHQLAELRGRMVLLYFFSSEELDWEARLREVSALSRPHDRQALQVALIDQALDLTPAAAAAIRRLDESWLHLTDPGRTLKEHYAAAGVDRLTLLDQKGRVAYLYRAPLRPSRDIIAGHLKRVAAGKALPMPRTGFSESVGVGALNVLWQWAPAPGGQDQNQPYVSGAWVDPEPPPELQGELFFSLNGRLHRAKVGGGDPEALFTFPGAGILWRGPLKSGGPARWLTFRAFAENRRLAAIDAAGLQLWDYKEPNVVNHFAVGDVQGDANAEVLLGFNAAGGVQLIDAAGGVLWRRPDVVNVFNVGLLDIDGDGALEALCTTRRGPVLILTGDGKDVKYIDPGLLTTIIRPRATFGPHQNVVLCAGSASRGEGVTLLALNNQRLWERVITTDGRNEIVGLEAGHWRERAFAASATLNGVVTVLDTGGVVLYQAHTGKGLLGLLTADLNADGDDEILIWGQGRIIALTYVREESANGKASLKPAAK